METRLVTLVVLGVGLAACSETTSNPPPQTVADVNPPPRLSETAPRSDNRAAVVRGQLPGDVGDRVYFDYDSSLLSADAQRTLQRQAVWLKGAGPVALTIEGHADERGTREYNLALGDRRANAVRDFLVTQGVPPDRLRTLSYGKERPQVAGHDEASWAQNRRGVSVPQ
jgi:peptidoglycan-associated lipoprotein